MQLRNSSGAALICSIALAAAAVGIAAHAQEGSVGNDVVVAMQNLLDDLTPAQVRYGRTSLGDPERYIWNYRVANRVGLPVFELDDADRELLWELLGSALSPEGTAQARDIIAIERYVYETTQDESRDPDWYFLTLFNMPRTEGDWGWRFEGHHLSVNLTLLNGEVVGATPLFLGSQPSIRGEIEPLAREASAGRALLEALDTNQRRRAVFASEPPDDILTQTDRRAMRPNQLGIRYAELDTEQQALMRALIQTYVARLRPALAAAEFAAIEEAGLDDIRFGWAGPVTPGSAHYYRVHGRDFLIEYGHVNDDPQHVHSVWRKFDDDFARRTLRDFVATRTTVVDATLSPVSPTPATQPTADATRAAAPPAVPEAVVQALELVPAAVGANGCDARAAVVFRRSLAPADDLPRNVMRSPDLEILTLRVDSAEPREGVENLCQEGDKIDALSPRHPDGSLLGKSINVTLELIGDARVSVWRATRIRALASEQ
jgi:hypothetical protein